MNTEKDPRRSVSPVRADNASTASSFKWSRRLRNVGVEERGISPVPVEERVDTRLYQIFFLWFSWNFNILSFSAGTLGPFIFNLGLRDSCLVILFFNLLSAAPPAYFCTWGPKSGLRQMVTSRYSFGYWPVILVSILNVTVMCGFTVLNCILGGQTLAAISGDTLSWTVGIVIIAVVSLFVSFCGIKAVTWYERLAWIPVVITIIIALGVGGKHLSNPPIAAPATAADVLSFASVIAGFVITYSPLSSDYTVYFSPDVSSLKMFLYAYTGFLLPIVPLQCLGAAAAVSATAYTPWMEGYEKSNVGGLLLAMLAPTKGFGKFLTVLLSLSVAANVAPTFYSIGFNCQIILPMLARVPRYFFSLVALAIILPISIVGQHKFTEALTNFLSVIGYWATAYIAIILIEHFVFRHGSFANYDVAAWNSPRRLPLGIAGLSAAIGCFGLVVPSMYQVWFEGPIGKKTGDIGFELAFALAGVLYLPMRWVERRATGR